MKTYRMICGCRHKFETLVKSRKKNSFRCPLHRWATTDCIVVACSDCGSKIIVNSKGAKKTRCDACQKTRAHKIRYGQIDVVKKKNDYELSDLSKKQLAAQDHSDCQNWWACGDVAAIKNECRPCISCDRYTPSL